MIFQGHESQRNPFFFPSALVIWNALPPGAHMWGVYATIPDWQGDNDSQPKAGFHIDHESAIRSAVRWHGPYGRGIAYRVALVRYTKPAVPIDLCYEH